MGGSMNKFPSIDDSSGCMKCGFCMSACPVYAIDHIESHVARGRNVLIHKLSENEIKLDSPYDDRLSFCLLCGRCETVCPAKVPSARINIAARTQVIRQKGMKLYQRLIYRGLLNNRKLMAILLGIASSIPGVSVKNGTPLRHMADSVLLFTRKLALPKISRPFLSKRISNNVNMTEKKRIAVFPGCAFEFFFADIGEQIIKDLKDAGYNAVYPQKLACCGIAVRSAGDLETAQKMAKKNIDALSDFDTIVTGCATCGSALKDYGNWFENGDEWQSSAQKLAEKTRDLSEFLAEHEIKSEVAETLIVTYHDPCHMRWHQGVREQPRKLLQSIKGIKYVEMEGADDCCGLGGSFSITHRDISLAIQDKKMKAIKKTNADIVVTSCPGCIVQLKDGAIRHGLDIQVMHISQLLDGQSLKNIKQHRSKAKDS